MKQRYFIQLSYNGEAYSGWQRQKNAISVQQSIEEALCTILRLEDIRIVGCGRTDTGVHSKNYYAHVDMEIPEGLDAPYRLNQILQKDIAILNIAPVDKEAHARFDAEERRYEYKIHFTKDPFREIDSVLIKKKPDLDRMNEAANHLLGTQDFTSFAKVDNDANHHFCDLYMAQWTSKNDSMIFQISANRFLRNMVRAVVGTLLEVGYGKRTPEEFKELIAAKNRNMAGSSAPAKGLSLIDIKYPYAVCQK